MRRQALPGRFMLWRADLDDEITAGNKVVFRRRNQALEDREAALATIERHVRLIMANTDRQLFHIWLSDVRWIAEDKIKRLAGRDRAEQIAAEKAHASGNTMLDGVALSNGQRV